jgi:two-component system sensor kinase FixL
MVLPSSPSAPLPAAVRKPHVLVRVALIIVAYLVAFVALDFLTRAFEGLPGVVAWYPPAGLGFALLLVFGARFAPALGIASLLSSFFVYRLSQPPEALLLWAFLVALIYGVAALLLRHRIPFDWHLRRLRDVVYLIFATVLVSALLAVLSVSGSALGGAVPRSEAFGAIFDWWIGETVGVLTITPLLLVCVLPWLRRLGEGRSVMSPVRRLFCRSTLSVVGQTASLAVALYWVFGANVPDEFRPLYIVIVPLVWIALQHGFKGVILGMVASNSGVIFATWLFGFDVARLGELELLMIVLCVVGLTMGAIVTERRQADAALHESEGRRHRQVRQPFGGTHVGTGAGRDRWQKDRRLHPS